MSRKKLKDVGHTANQYSSKSVTHHGREQDTELTELYECYTHNIHMNIHIHIHIYKVGRTCWFRTGKRGMDWIKIKSILWIMKMLVYLHNGVYTAEKIMTP